MDSLDDDDYGDFQRYLAMNPNVGRVIKASHGIRKVRWALPGNGKSGGIRVLYFWRPETDQIFLLYLFRKGERSNLTHAQVRQLAQVTKAFLK